MVTTEVERLVLTIEQVAALLGISRASGYLAARKGEIPTIKIGRRLLVPRVALEKMLADIKPSECNTG